MDQKDRVIRLTATATRDGVWLVARYLEVEVTSQGETIEAALANLREALELYFEDEPVPASSEPIVAPVEIRIPGEPSPPMHLLAVPEPRNCTNAELSRVGSYATVRMRSSRGSGVTQLYECGALEDGELRDRTNAWFP